MTCVPEKPPMHLFSPPDSFQTCSFALSSKKRTLFHHISSCVEPSLMFCRVAESCVAGNDKTDHRYPAHLLPELNRQNNLIQNHLHPPHYLYWRQNFNFSLPIYIESCRRYEYIHTLFCINESISNFSLTVSVIWME